MTGFEPFLATVLSEAGQEARRDGSATIEAQHLLLAIAAQDEPTTTRVLAAVGLDHERVRAALDREFERSLAGAGAAVAAGPSSPRPGSPPIGASVKLAMERGLGSTRRKRDLRPVHLLLGIVQAEVGTVPWALALAGVDPADLADRIRQALAVRDGD